MLSRHFLRTTVLQSLYASEFAEIRDVITAEKNFRHTIERFNDLGLTQVSTLIQIRHIAEIMLEEGRHKYHPTQDDLNPSMRFVNNEFLRRIADNYEFRKQLEDRCINWNDQEDLFRKAFTSFRKTPDYIEYIAGDPEKGASIEGRNIEEEDMNIMLKLFKFLMNDEGLTNSYDERSLFWEEDFYQIAQYEFMFLKTLTLETLNESMSWPMVYDKRNEQEVEGYEFARQLLLVTLRNRNENDELIKKHLKGWEFDRVALIDVLMINMAITEFTEFPSIPEKVTIDEYIEVSKEFSSDKSKLFINGILDKLILELRSAGRIHKTGRGIVYFE